MEIMIILAKGFWYLIHTNPIKIGDILKKKKKICIRPICIVFVVTRDKVCNISLNFIIGLFIWGFTLLSTLYRSYHDG